MSRPPLPASRTSSSNWEDEFKKVKYQGQGEEPLADQAVGLLKALLLPLLPLASFLARPLAACLARRPPVSGVMNARSGPGGGGGARSRSSLPAPPTSLPPAQRPGLREPLSPPPRPLIVRLRC